MTTRIIMTAKRQTKNKWKKRDENKMSVFFCQTNFNSNTKTNKTLFAKRCL